ncbi:hypothetical protein B0A49_06524 [Cryomyces minteri]|uniref:Cryptochrome DASH n=1 Tax=Cryomyces minteri TaxID=331657 RepID=A0A4U0WZ17_9PEZI|nr:hypothetical protein B0A49_06524 [Cryomyces minteri]
MASPRILIYIMRRDLRIADNPILSEMSRLYQQTKHPFTHLLPIYVFPADQVEVSGFLRPDEQRSPYPEARSFVGDFWRCGHHRAKFVAESVWCLKKDLEGLGSGLEIRVGRVGDVLKQVLEGYKEKSDAQVTGVWMTSEEGVEERREERDVKRIMNQEGMEFRLWTDEKYFIDENAQLTVVFSRDLPFTNPSDLPDIFTSFRKTVEPLREAPRRTLLTPAKGTLPPLPPSVPPQAAPFTIPSTLSEIIEALHKPLDKDLDLEDAPKMPPNTTSVMPFHGGSQAGRNRTHALITNGSMSGYKDTRNGLLGTDFSTKLSAWLALGCITARQIHWDLVDFEDGKTALGASAPGYGDGENKGTAAVRFELLWRDYMRLCTRNFRQRLFHVEGFRDDSAAQWKYVSSPYSASSTSAKGSGDARTRHVLQRFLCGTTGTGLIDASQRELFLTGYTSNRARQNVASFLAKHLGIDWRLGAEWYETCLVDFDVSSNWGNWQYVAGVGNDPRGQSRVFNPVKQAVDYDAGGEYVRAWVPELRDVGRPIGGGSTTTTAGSATTTTTTTTAGGGSAAAAGSTTPAAPRHSTSKTGSTRPPAPPSYDPHTSPESLMGVFQAWRLPSEERRRLSLSGVEWVLDPLVRIDFSVNRRGGGSAKRGFGSRGRGGGGGGGGGTKADRKGRGKGKGGRGSWRGGDVVGATAEAEAEADAGGMDREGS